MHPAPIIVTNKADIPASAYYAQTLSSGEEIYRVALTGAIYALQPATPAPTTLDRRPGLFDLRRELGRAPTAQEWQDARRNK